MASAFATPWLLLRPALKRAGLGRLGGPAGFGRWCGVAGSKKKKKLEKDLERN